MRRRAMVSLRGALNDRHAKSPLRCGRASLVSRDDECIDVMGVRMVTTDEAFTVDGKRHDERL